MPDAIEKEKRRMRLRRTENTINKRRRQMQANIKALKHSGRNNKLTSIEYAEMQDIIRGYEILVKEPGRFDKTNRSFELMNIMHDFIDRLSQHE